MGENSSFSTRNNSVLSLINALGGGSLTFTTPGSTQTVLAPLTGPNPVATITYAAPGGIGTAGAGAGQFLTVDALGRGTALGFAAGTLSGAMAGSLAVVFDVNFMQNQFDITNSQNFTKNLIGYVGAGGNPNGAVPEPGTALLLGSGLLAWGIFRKRTSDTIA
jgi:hypothetical protein